MVLKEGGRFLKKKKKKHYLFALWYDNGEKIELQVKSWTIDNGFLYLNLENETRAMATHRIREFLVKDVED